MRTHSSRDVLASLGPLLGAGGTAIACLAIVACTVTSTTTNNGVAPSGDAGGPTTDAGTPTPTDAAADADTDADTAEPESFVRIAHLSPDAPAVDVCFTPAGRTFDGQTPQVAALAAAQGFASDGGDAGMVAGLSFPQMTSYFIVPPGSYAVRLVAAGAADCSTSVVDLATVTTTVNAYTTIAAVGELHVVQTDQALKLVSLSDDVTAAPGTVGIRVLNASPSLTSVDFGTGTQASTTFAPLFTGVGFGQVGLATASDAGTVDAHGYLASQPYIGATLSAHVTNAGNDTVTATGLTVDAQAAATFALINGVTGGAAAQLLQCADADDSGTPTLFARCSIVSTAP